MVSKVVISPQEVRGLGNIVVKTDSTSYACYLSHVAEQEDGFILTYGAESLTVVVSAQRVAVDGSITVTATLLDEEDAPMVGETVELFYEVN